MENFAYLFHSCLNHFCTDLSDIQFWYTRKGKQFDIYLDIEDKHWYNERKTKCR